MENCSICRLERKVDLLSNKVLELLYEIRLILPYQLEMKSYVPGEKRLRQGIQADFPHENLRRWGCYFFALLRWAEEIRRKGFDEAEIIPLFNQARQQMMPNPNGNGTQIPIINENCFVNDPVRLLNFLAGKRAVTKVALWTNKGNHAAPEVKIFVAREKQSAGLAHFVLIIEGKRWDSLPPVSPPRNPAGFRVLV